MRELAAGEHSRETIHVFFSICVSRKFVESYRAIRKKNLSQTDAFFTSEYNLTESSSFLLRTKVSRKFK